MKMVFQSSITNNNSYIYDKMELIFTHQVGFDQLKNEQFDFFLAASGYENRCSYLIDSIEINADNKIVIAFEDKKDLLYREKNDNRFRDEGFEFIEESESDTGKINRVLDAICNSSCCSGRIRILVDYSCMSKLWYAGILKYFISNEPRIDHLELFFSYTSAVFSEPLDSPARQILAAPRGLLKANIKSKKPRAVILGLGYEKYLTSTVIEKLNYHSLFAFYSDPAFDSRYADKVTRNNKKILGSLPDDHIYKYPVTDLKKTDDLLTSLTMKLRLDYHVSILPAGPKPFTLSALLLAARYPDIEVWTIDTGYSPAAYNRNPTGEPMVCKLLFSNDEDLFL